MNNFNNCRYNFILLVQVDIYTYKDTESREVDLF